MCGAVVRGYLGGGVGVLRCSPLLARGAHHANALFTVRWRCVLAFIEKL